MSVFFPHLLDEDAVLKIPTLLCTAIMLLANTVPSSAGTIATIALDGTVQQINGLVIGSVASSNCSGFELCNAGRNPGECEVYFDYVLAMTKSGSSPTVFNYTGTPAVHVAQLKNVVPGSYCRVTLTVQQ